MPSSVFGQYAPSKRINVGAIGVGRISRGHDMPGILQYDNARIIAVCDLDAHRVEEGKKFVNDFYAKKTGKPYDGVTGYANYHELLANKDIDAVVVSTPDHWHALIAIDAVRAGKDVYLQKPASLTIAEGRAMSNAVQASGRILQIGSQQRSTVQFRYAAELVRNGRIGDLQRVEVGLPGDPPGGDKTPMPVPAGFNYDMWLGETPSVFYTVDRVHPPQGLRPPRMAALPPVRRRHDHRLGRPPHRQRPLGHGHRIHRPRRSLGRSRVPPRRPVGRARPLQDRSPLCQRRPHEHQRRLSQRHQVLRHPRAGSSSRAATSR